MSGNHIALKLFASVLAGLMVSDVVLASEEKYFVCKITEVRNTIYHPSRDKSCGGGYSECNRETKEFKFKDFTDKGDEYEKHNLIGNFEDLITIYRETGKFSQVLGNKDDIDSYISYDGTCELITKQVKLKF